MKTNSVLNKIFACVGATALLFCAAGCSGSKGSNTACGDFKKMSKDDQKKVVTDMLKEKGDSEPGGLKVTASHTAVKAYCSTVGGEKDKIGNASLDNLIKKKP
ncbi:MAG: hypothetical protein Q4C71_01910 [Microbacteriaceae bacterium]|nr:hypothetical protein [Microbacteriaceae bacterium]